MIKAIGEYLLKGRGIVFGGRDLVGDRFTPETDLGDTRPFEGLPVFYDHTLGDLQSQIGTVKAWVPDDEGIDVEIEIDRRHKYAAQVMDLVKKGMLGLSTGALSHLVVREGGDLKRWVVGEISLTPTPAEPRTMAVSATKSTDKAGNRLVSKHYAIDPNRNKGTHTMAINPQELRDALKDVLPDLLNGAQGEPVKGGGVVDSTKSANQAPGHLKLTTRGNTNEPTEAMLHWVRTNDDIAAKAVLVEGTGANGGFLVPRDFYTQIIDRRDQQWIGAKLGVQRYTTDRQIFDMADQNGKSNFAFVAESGAANFDEPTFTQSAITVYTASLAMKVSNQLLRDNAMDLEGFLTREIGRAYARHLNDYMINGTGSSQPYGVLARATVSETLASATGVDQADIINIVHKLPSWYADDNTGWVMQNSTLGAIRALQGNFFSFQPTPMGTMDSLYGKPIAITDKIAALGTGNKPIIFGNWGYYAFVENLGLEIARNPYTYQPNYQTAIFCTVRWGGDVNQAEAFVYGVNP